jgi:hypothetical protein
MMMEIVAVHFFNSNIGGSDTGKEFMGDFCEFLASSEKRFFW